MRKILGLTLAWGCLVLGVGTAWTDEAKSESTAVVVDKEARTVTVDCKVAPRKIEDERYKEIYPLEVIACWPFPKGQKAHETVLTFEAKPSAVHQAVESLGLKAGKPVKGGGEKDVPEGPDVKLFLEFADGDGKPQKLPLEQTVYAISSPTKPAFPKTFQWRFTGSVMSQPDPTLPAMVYGADLTGTMISIFPVTDQTVFQSNLTMAEEKYLKLETRKDKLPKVGTPIKLIIQAPAAK
jgi:hypothetical protein